MADKPVIKIIEIEHLENFRTELLKSKDESVIAQKWDWFFDSYDIINFDFHSENFLWRARKIETDECFHYEHELMAPPQHLAKLGRLNDDKDPMFYASMSCDTALNEIDANEGDLVQIIGLKSNNKNRARCATFGEIMNAHKGITKISPSLTSEIKNIISKIPPKLIKSYVYMDALVSEIMTDKNAYKNKYFHSRVLSGYLKNKLSSIEGVIYPSVAHENSMNLALSPSSAAEKFDITFNLVVKVKRKYNFGFYDLDIQKTASHSNYDGRIIWKQQE